MKLELAHEMMKNEDSALALRRKIEKYLDTGCGGCYLRQTEIAQMTQNSLLYFHNTRYLLKSWVIMPNHAHFLLKPLPDFTLSSIIHSIKSFSAKETNKILGRRGKFWQEDYFDRYIRDIEHFNKTIRYIENNPVKAELCEKPSDRQWSSAFNKGARMSSSANADQSES